MNDFQRLSEINVVLEIYTIFSIKILHHSQVPTKISIQVNWYYFCCLNGSQRFSVRKPASTEIPPRLGSWRYILNISFYFQKTSSVFVFRRKKYSE